jgi:hypothetical protein
MVSRNKFLNCLDIACIRKLLLKHCFLLIPLVLTKYNKSASELYQPSDCRLSVKLVPKFEDRRCRVVSEADPYGRNLVFLDLDDEVYY